MMMKMIEGGCSMEEINNKFAEYDPKDIRKRYNKLQKSLQKKSQDSSIC